MQQTLNPPKQNFKLIRLCEVIAAIRREFPHEARIHSVAGQEQDRYLGGLPQFPQEFQAIAVRHPDVKDNCRRGLPRENAPSFGKRKSHFYGKTVSLQHAFVELLYFFAVLDEQNRFAILQLRIESW